MSPTQSVWHRNGYARFARTIARGGVIALTALAALPGCGVPSGGLDDGSVGLTSGGTQDLSEARSQIRAGRIPKAEAITVEGFLSEHDIPFTAPADPPEIYASLAAAWRHGITMPAPGVDLFVRLGTTIDPADYQRKPLNLVVAVDRSGSMKDSTSATDGTARLDMVRRGIRALIGRLNANDQLTLISFNERTRVDVGARSVTGSDAFETAMSRWRPEGNTNLQKALQTAFAEAERNAAFERISRVILFSDARPTTGAKQAADLAPLISRNADQGIGFTMMGIGSDFGTQLAAELVDVKLANSFFIDGQARSAEIFEQEFEYFVSPAASDLTLEIALVDGVAVSDVYGVPDYIPGINGARITIPTLFFSSRQGGGAIVVRLTSAETPDFTEAITYGRAELSYTLTGGAERLQVVDLTLPAGLDPTAETPWYSDPAAERATLLLDAALVLRESTRLARIGRETAATDLLNEFIAGYELATLGMPDRTDPTSRGLREERELLEALLATVTPYNYVPPSQRE